MRLTTINGGILLFLLILIICIIDNANAQKEPKEVVTENGKGKAPIKEPIKEPKAAAKGKAKEPQGKENGPLPKVPPNPKSPIAKLCFADPKVMTEKKLGKVEDVPFKVNIGLKDVYTPQGEDVKITIECKTPLENLIIYADTVSKDHVGQWKEQNGFALDPSCPGDKYGTLISTKAPPKTIELLWTPPWVTGYNDITFKAAVFTKTGFSTLTSKVYKEAGAKITDPGKEVKIADNKNNDKDEGKGKGKGFGASPDDVKEEKGKVGNENESGNNASQQTSIIFDTNNLIKLLFSLSVAGFLIYI